MMSLGNSVSFLDEENYRNIRSVVKVIEWTRRARYRSSVLSTAILSAESFALSTCLSRFVFFQIRKEFPTSDLLSDFSLLGDIILHCDLGLGRSSHLCYHAVSCSCCREKVATFFSA